jgi:hypothetical protein
VITNGNFDGYYGIDNSGHLSAQSQVLPQQPICSCRAKRFRVFVRCGLKVRAAHSAIQHKRSGNATFADPRSVFLDLILCGHEIDAAEFAMRKAYWPIGSHP